MTLHAMHLCTAPEVHMIIAATERALRVTYQRLLLPAVAKNGSRGTVPLPKTSKKQRMDRGVSLVYSRSMLTCSRPLAQKCPKLAAACS